MRTVRIGEKEREHSTIHVAHLIAEGLSEINLKPTSCNHPRIFAHLCTCSHVYRRHCNPGHSAAPIISQDACGLSTSHQTTHLYLPPSLFQNLLQ